MYFASCLSNMLLTLFICLDCTFFLELLRSRTVPHFQCISVIILRNIRLIAVFIPPHRPDFCRPFIFYRLSPHNMELPSKRLLQRSGASISRPSSPRATPQRTSATGRLLSRLLFRLDPRILIIILIILIIIRTTIIRQYTNVLFHIWFPPVHSKMNFSGSFRSFYCHSPSQPFFQFCSPLLYLVFSRVCYLDVVDHK